MFHKIKATCGMWDKCSALGELGRYEDAFQAFNNAINLNPNYDLAWHNKSKVLRKLGREKEASEAYDKYIELSSLTIVVTT